MTPEERLARYRAEADEVAANLMRTTAEMIRHNELSEVKAARVLGISRTTLRKRLSNVRLTQPRLV